MTDPLLQLSKLQALIRQSGNFGATLYVLLFVLTAICFVPGSLLVIAGGLIFGPVYGTLLSMAASTLASSLCFWLARLLGRDLLLQAFGKSAVFQAIENGIRQHGVDFLLFTRLIPLFPWTLQNYVYGLTAIAFWPFTLISALTTLPGLLIYTLMAADLATHGVSGLFFLKLCLAGALLFALAQLAKAWARRRGLNAAGVTL